MHTTVFVRFVVNEYHYFMWLCQMNINEILRAALKVLT